MNVFSHVNPKNIKFFLSLPDSAQDTIKRQVAVLMSPNFQELPKEVKQKELEVYFSSVPYTELTQAIYALWLVNKSMET